MRNQDSPQLKAIQSWARLLDSQFSFFGTKYRFGIDPLMNLLPFIGSFSGFIAGGVMLLMAIQAGASGKVIIKMLMNILVDYIIGSIPIVGQVFDFVYKANNRNVALLERHFNEGAHQGSGMGYLMSILFIAFLLSTALLYAFALLLIQLGEFVHSMF